MLAIPDDDFAPMLPKRTLTAGRLEGTDGRVVGHADWCQTLHLTRAMEARNEVHDTAAEPSRARRPQDVVDMNRLCPATTASTTGSDRLTSFAAGGDSFKVSRSLRL